ncbi:hypothetical protein N9381_09540, partial [Paracoccaceae bacterium]|nr:hypothetical protein [Paracoccaceae bacterium]
MAAHILGTIVAYTVYIKLSSLGDGYAPEDFQGFNGNSQDFVSTIMVHGIYHYIGALLPGFLAPMALGLVVAIATWHAFRDVYTQINRKLFWACNLFPHFLIWSGSSSKEQIVVIFGIIVIGFAAKRSFAASRLNITSLVFVFLSLAFIFLVRPNYFVIYFTIFVTSLIAPTLHKIKINRLSIGIWAFTFILTIMGAVVFAAVNTTFFSKDVIVFMKRVEASFMNYEAGSNRYNIQWNDVSDFFYNSLWGIPQGFIGPTLFEAITKPIQFPVFLEGVVYLFILCYLFVRIFKLAGASNMLRVHILPYYFMALVIVFVSYPYLIFNAGSALRYKQAMHPVLIFYPLLILAYAR